MSATERSHLLLEIFEGKITIVPQSGEAFNASTAEAKLFDAWVMEHFEEISAEVHRDTWTLHERWLVIRDLAEAGNIVRSGNTFVVPAATQETKQAVTAEEENGERRSTKLG